MLNTEKVAPGLPPDFMNRFYDLRALAMSVSAITHIAEEGRDELGGDELNAARRVLSILSDKALQFANEADEFLLHLPDTQTAGGESND